MSEQKLALVFATISRPHAAQRLVLSARKYFPSMPIYIADQSQPGTRQEAFYSDTGCRVVWMDHDAGVCASRNACVDMVEEPYFLLCDDDFILTEETDFTHALTLLDADPTIGVVGGRLVDISYHPETKQRHENQRFWELYLHYDPDKGLLTAIPIHYFSPNPEILENIRFFECDAVMNFAVFRKSMFGDAIQWDPRFKSNGEHEDFYLNLKVNGEHRVAYVPELIAHHNHPPLQGYSDLRTRTHGWQLFLDKWSLTQYLELDNGLRIKNNVGNVQPYSVGFQNFYSAPAHTTVKKERNPGTILISNITDELIPPTYGQLNDRHPSRGTDYRRLSIDRECRVFALGGHWDRPAPIRLAQYTSSCLSEDDIARIDWSFDVGEIENDLQNGDVFVYLRPKLKEYHELHQLENLSITLSIALGDSYAVYREPCMIDAQILALNTQNALALPNPNILGDLIIEVSVAKDGEIIYEGTSSTVMLRSLSCAD